jgi:hypothetical protein
LVHQRRQLRPSDSGLGQSDPRIKKSNSQQQQQQQRVNTVTVIGFAETARDHWFSWRSGTLNFILCTHVVYSDQGDVMPTRPTLLIAGQFHHGAILPRQRRTQSTRAEPHRRAALPHPSMSASGGGLNRPAQTGHGGARRPRSRMTQQRHRPASHVAVAKSASAPIKVLA